MKVTKKRLLELLDLGATIEYVSWGPNPNIYVRLLKSTGNPQDSINIFESVNISSFFAVRDLLEVVRRKELTTFYKKRRIK